MGERGTTGQVHITRAARYCLNVGCFLLESGEMARPREHAWNVVLVPFQNTQKYD